MRESRWFRAWWAAAARAAILLALALAGCAGDSLTTGTASPTATLAPTAVNPATATATKQATAAPSSAPTSTPSPSRSATSTLTATEAPSSTPTTTPSLTPSPSPTQTPSATAVLTPLSCAALSGATLGGAHILSATTVAGSESAPEYCKVAGKVDTSLNFELRLPTVWNHKVVFLGGGGYDGFISTPDANPAIQRNGYVTIATDSGHKGSPFDATWALGDPEAVDNFAFLGRHRVLAAARAIVAARYAAPIRRTYFQGGSTGGKEALIEAQQWPDDWDGIIALEPALSFTALNLGANRIVQQLLGKPEGFLPAAAIGTFSRAVLAACDGLDGLEDGIVANIAACHFDPAVLLCSEAAATDCLTAAQIDSVNTIHSPLQLGFALAHGTTSYPGYALNGEEDSASGWRIWLTGFNPSPPGSLLFTLQDQFIKYLLIGDAHFDSLAFTPGAYTSELIALSSRLDATDPDLSAFSGHGGKLILWHGLADSAISPYSTVAYYEQVVAAAGGQAQADAFVRFYTSAGVDHTGTGRGATLFDLLGALDGWVEAGTVPEDLLAYRPAVSFQVPFRPLCRYPTYPRYGGSGDPNDAASFSCSSAP